MSNAIDSSSLYDIEGPLALSSGLSVYGIIGLIALLILSVISYRLYRKKKHKRQAAPILSPYEKALKGLSQLNISADSPIFASELEKILKNFTEAKIERPIMHTTTEEFLSYLRPQYLNTELFQKLSESLKYYDLVKFAKLPLPETNRYSCIEDAKALIEAIQTQADSLNPHIS